MQKAILIVGQGPSKSGRGEKPLSGPGSGEKLAELAGVTIEVLHEQADVVNLLDEYHGSNGKGDCFPAKLAKKKADEIKLTFTNYKSVILLGTNVAKACGVYPIDMLQWHNMTPPFVAVVPHPSGVNHWYNDPKNKADASAFLKSLFSDCKVPTDEVLIRTKSERAKFCTEYIEKFDVQLREWWQVAEILLEVERDQLYLEVDCKSFGDWLTKHAPTTRSHCYGARKKLNLYLEHGIPMEDVRQIPSETAAWAVNPKNISPAALKDPKVIEALKNPKKKAIEALQKAAPDQHIEEIHNWMLKFSASQKNSISEAYEAYRMLVDEKASFEDFFESVSEDWFDSLVDETSTFRQKYHDYMSGRNLHDGKDSETQAAKSAVASL